MPIEPNKLQGKTGRFSSFIRKKIRMAKSPLWRTMMTEEKGRGHKGIDQNQDQDQDHRVEGREKDLSVGEEVIEMIKTTMEEMARSVCKDTKAIKEEITSKDSMIMKVCIWVKIEEKMKAKVISILNKAQEIIEGGNKKEADKRESNTVTKDFIWDKIAMKARVDKIVTKVINMEMGMFLPNKVHK
jgi:hypothetical protein